MAPFITYLAADMHPHQFQSRCDNSCCACEEKHTPRAPRGKQSRRMPTYVPDWHIYGSEKATSKRTKTAKTTTKATTKKKHTTPPSLFSSLFPLSAHFFCLPHSTSEGKQATHTHTQSHTHTHTHTKSRARAAAARFVDVSFLESTSTIFALCVYGL